MTVLVSNRTPFTIWRVGGGLVGACRSAEEALGIMRDLRASWPQNEYVCKDIDGREVAEATHAQ